MILLTFICLNLFANLNIKIILITSFECIKEPEIYRKKKKKEPKYIL